MSTERKPSLTQNDPWGHPTIEAIEADLPEDVRLASTHWRTWDLGKIQRLILCRMAGLNLEESASAAGFHRTTWTRWAQEHPALEEMVEMWCNRQVARIAAGQGDMALDSNLDDRLRFEIQKYQLDRRSKGFVPPAQRVEQKIDANVQSSGVMVAPEGKSAEEWAKEAALRTGAAAEPSVESTED